MKFEIKHRWSGRVIFTAEIECNAGASLSVKLGLAVRAADLKGADLEGADLEGADLKGAYLKGAYLKGAYLRGADLRGADLRGAYLRGAYLRGAYLRGADLRGAYLEGADLRGAYLEGADLRGADLEGADFGSAPIIPNIHTAVFNAATQTPDALDMGDWHTCETTHCRAGWVTTLAGEAGAKLEDEIGTPAAAMAIYAASDAEYFQRDGCPDFYCGNDAALADMKRLAELEAAQ